MIREEIIRGALMELGVISAIDTPSAEDSALCVVTLDGLLDELSEYGLLYSQTRVGTVNFAAGSGTVTLATDYGYAPTAMGKDTNGNDVPMTVINHSVWMNIADKTRQGAPIYLHIDSGKTGWLWPVPDADGTFDLYYSRMVPASQPATAPGLPDKWGRALQVGIAAENAAKFGLPVTRQDRLVRRWAIKQTMLISEDVDVGELAFTVDD